MIKTKFAFCKPHWGDALFHWRVWLGYCPHVVGVVQHLVLKKNFCRKFWGCVVAVRRKRVIWLSLMFMWMIKMAHLNFSGYVTALQ